MVAAGFVIGTLLLGLFTIVFFLMIGKIKPGQLEDNYTYWDMIEDGTIKPIYCVVAFNQAYMDDLKRFFGMAEYPKNWKRWGKDKKFLWRRSQYIMDRTFGYYHSVDDAREVVINNHLDIHETCYDYVCIDAIYEGIHPFASEKLQEWYKFDHATETYYQIDRPEETKRICNFGLG